MKSSEKKVEKKENPIYILNDIECVDTVLSEYELHKLREYYSTIENFNEITEYLARNIKSNRIDQRDIIIFFNILKKITLTKRTARPLYNYQEKRGLARSFFELPEILSHRLFSKK